MHIDILRKLVSFKSISPNDAGAMQFCGDFLKQLGFDVLPLESGGVKNLYAKLGNFEKNICFAGHIDVVPPLVDWSSDPFELSIRNEKAYGRGVDDMKGPLSSCLAAVSEAVDNNSIPANTSLSFLLTSDEEIMGDNGTKVVVNHLKNIKEKITLCVLCESCSPYGSGEYIKTGCRGSLNINIRSVGTQCHVAAAPSLGNHLHKLIKVLNELCNTPLDSGSANFDPSSIQLTSLDTTLNTVRNIVPSYVEALLNVRFNDNWTIEKLKKHILSKTEGFEVTFEQFGEAFIGCSQEVAEKLKNIIGGDVKIGTRGGNSDALFIKDITNVVEIGSPLSEAHVVDEFIALKDLEILRNIYSKIIHNYN